MNSLRSIRKIVFAMSQSEFATVIGRTQASVSRWENGGSPTLHDMQAIRDAALARGLDWSDEWFFKFEVTPEPAE